MISKMVAAIPFTGNTDSGPAHYKVIQQTEQIYDPAGNLSAIFTDGAPAISYRYDGSGRPIQKTYGTAKNGKPALTADIAYDPMGRLGSTTFRGGALSSPLVLTYEWDDADQLTRRTWNGRTLRYEYDPSGQLLKVIDAGDQSILEAYTYDPAGNMLSKLLHGQTTTMTYNAGNQLATSRDSSGTLAYTYDKAGRMLGTSTQPQNTYGWLDKVTQATQPGGGTTTHTYWPDGQLASISSSKSSSLQSPIPNLQSSSETFLWDGLALIQRNDTIYIIEPHPSGGIPIASHPVGKPKEITYHLNDMLGTTLATAGPEGVHFSSLTSFGQPLKSASSSASLETTAPTAPVNPAPQSNHLPPTKR